MIDKTALIAAHIDCNLGIYFDKRESLGGGLHYAFSETITDAYWNFGYREDGAQVMEREAQQIAACAESHGRVAALWQIAETPPLPGWQTFSEEVWMTKNLLKSADPQDGTNSEIEIRVHAKPTRQMILTFEDAYGGEGTNGDIGYFSLPPEYGAAYGTGRSVAPARSWAIEAVLPNHVAVAVASVAIAGEFGGLFSVATCHAFRRRGLGRLVSAAAVALAKREGAELAFLQTEKDSPVQRMYESLGFRTEFVGALLVRADSDSA